MTSPISSRVGPDAQPDAGYDTSATQRVGTSAPVVARAAVPPPGAVPQPPAPEPPAAPGPVAAPPRAPIEPKLPLGPGARRARVVGRLVLLQSAVVVVALIAGTGRYPLAAGIGVLFLVLLVPLFLRADGTWWTEVRGARRRLRQRQRAGQFMAPGFDVEGHDDDGVSIGMGTDDGGWFAAATFAAPSDLASARPVPVPLGRLAQLLTDGAVPVSAVQVVTWMVPAPHYLMPRQAASVGSYRQLSVDLYASQPAAMTGRTWVSLRFDHADAVARTDGTEGTARRVLATALRRLGKTLKSVGATHQVLDPDQLSAAVRTCVGLDQTGARGPDGRPQQPREEWKFWSGGELSHVTFEVLRWPEQATSELLRELCQIPAAQLVYSICLRRVEAATGDPSPGERATPQVVVSGLLRVAATPARLADTVEQLTGRAGQAGLRLRRLDGVQGPAGYVCAPTGGARW